MIFLLVLRTSKPSISVFQSIGYDPVKLVALTGKYHSQGMSILWSSQ